MDGAPAELAGAVAAVTRAMEHAQAWFAATPDRNRLQAGARRFAFTIGRAYELALLIEHARIVAMRDRSNDAVAATRRFAAARVDFVLDLEAT